MEGVFCEGSRSFVGRGLLPPLGIAGLSTTRGLVGRYLTAPLAPASSSPAVGVGHMINKSSGFLRPAPLSIQKPSFMVELSPRGI